ncbi:tetratricopeptide repeat protein [Flagellimonas meridianipacifica]|uniref:DNA-binding CsgD family transcriptional regulator n=1 Tax=Flagellimonas meridianipacifica TaxID=1080225 RepID=A0A2T0MDE9_9FLAO|nr:tetratricopeptide repeat protein [Allomuricauda pacifica]PRX55514.1 DNA-binding CsgD family transcriptional regulator [Allomuricauda pacifica]
MKTSFHFPLFFVLFFFLGLQAQQNQKLDSLLKIYHALPDDTTKVNILADLHLATIYNDVEKAKGFALERIALSKKLNFEYGLAGGYYHLGGYFKNTYHRDSARYYFDKALEIYKKKKDEESIVMVNYSNAILEMEKGNYDKALGISNENVEKRKKLKDSLGLAIEYVFRSGIYEEIGSDKLAYQDILKALKLYEILDKPIRKADALYSLGSLETIFKNYTKGIEYFNEALDIYKANEDKLYEALVYSALGSSYVSLGEYDTAKKVLQQSVSLSREMKSVVLEGTAIRNLGTAYLKEGNPPESIPYYTKAISIHRENEMTIELVRSLAYAADAYNAMNKPNLAINHLNEAIKIREADGGIGGWGELFEGRSTAWELLGNYKNALVDHKQYQTLKDSAFQKEKMQQINELRTIYDTEKKEQQIVLQEKEITVLEQQAEIGTLQKILLGGGLVLSLIGFYGIRQKLKRNKLEKEKVDSELEFKKKELTTHALHLAKKNEVLEGLKQKAQEFKENEESEKGYQQLIRTINFDLQNDSNWENFARYFEEVHKDFNRTVKTKYPQVTSNELRLMALLKMNLSSKEIANILNISQEGIKKARYRLRKKLDITTEDSLQDLVLSL